MPDSPYYEQLLKAAEFTASLGLALPAISSLVYGSILQCPGFMQTVAANMNITEPEELMLKCNLVSLRLVEVIEQAFDFKAYLTVGSLLQGNTPSFRISEPYIRVITQNGSITDPDYSHHAWVTLENMEIIDLTFMTSVAMLSRALRDADRSQHFGAIVTGQADTLASRGVHYVPILVGEEFYKVFDPAYSSFKAEYFSIMSAMHPAVKSRIQNRPKHRPE